MSPDTPTIADAIAACLADLKRARHTRRLYAVALNHFVGSLERLGVTPAHSVSALTVESFIAFVAWLSQRPYAKSTRICYAAGAHALLNYLVIQGQLDPSPRDTMRLRQALAELNRQHTVRLPRVPDELAVQATVGAAYASETASPMRERDIALIQFLRTSGCRADEVVRLRVSDFDLRTRTARVVGKGTKERMACFGRVAGEALQAYWHARGDVTPDAPAFVRHDRMADSCTPMSTTALRTVVTRLARDAGLPASTVTPHAFRHAFATRLYEATRDLPLVQESLGHTDPKTTRVYASVSLARLREAHWTVYGDEEKVRG